MHMWRTSLFHRWQTGTKQWDSRKIQQKQDTEVWGMQLAILPSRCGQLTVASRIPWNFWKNSWGINLRRSCLVSMGKKIINNCIVNTQMWTKLPKNQKKVKNYHWLWLRLVWPMTLDTPIFLNCPNNLLMQLFFIFFTHGWLFDWSLTLGTSLGRWPRGSRQEPAVNKLFFS